MSSDNLGGTSGPANISSQKWNQAENYSIADLTTHDTTAVSKSFVDANSGRTYDDVISEQEARIDRLEKLVEALVAEFMPEHNV